MNAKRATDLTFATLIAATVLLWLLFDGTLGQPPEAALLMMIMLIKSTLIAGVFMDLWRTSRVALCVLVSTMALIGIGIVAAI